MIWYWRPGVVDSRDVRPIALETCSENKNLAAIEHVYGSFSYVQLISVSSRGVCYCNLLHTTFSLAFREIWRTNDMVESCGEIHFREITVGSMSILFKTLALSLTTLGVHGGWGWFNTTLRYPHRTRTSYLLSSCRWCLCYVGVCIGVT